MLMFCFYIILGVGVAVVLIFIFVYIVPYVFMKDFEDSDSYMVACTTCWFFFVLINCWYGGALTMFFTSEIRIPFTNVEQVMREYPNWKLLMMVGNDVHFQYKAVQVKSDYCCLDFHGRLGKPKLCGSLTDGCLILENIVKFDLFIK